MPAYIWATVKNGEPEKLIAYAKAAAQVAAQHGGRFNKQTLCCRRCCGWL